MPFVENYAEKHRFSTFNEKRKMRILQKIFFVKRGVWLAFLQTQAALFLR